MEAAEYRHMADYSAAVGEWKVLNFFKVDFFIF